MHGSPLMVHPELHEICTRWSQAVADMTNIESRMAYFENVLPELLSNQRLFIQLLNNMRKGRPFADLRQATMFDDELLLYLAPCLLGDHASGIADLPVLSDLGASYKLAIRDVRMIGADVRITARMVKA